MKNLWQTGTMPDRVTIYINNHPIARVAIEIQTNQKGYDFIVESFSINYLFVYWRSGYHEQKILSTCFLDLKTM